MINNIQAFKNAIHTVVGYSPDDIQPGKLQRFATSTRPNDTSGWCVFFPDLEHGAYGDWRTGISENWKAKMVRQLSTAERQKIAQAIEQVTKERYNERAAIWLENRQKNLAIWNQSQHFTDGDPVALYLASRGLGDVYKRCDCLRYLADHPFYDNGKLIGWFPVMLAKITAPSGEAVALHRTYLTKEGVKADVPTVKKITSTSGSLIGASIKLFKPTDGVLGVAEGIETALAATLGSTVPTQAAYSASGLASFVWPSSVQHLVIFADNDQAGIEAAEKLKQRAFDRGISCKVTIPSEPGKDWADIWVSGQEAGA
jgi:putative DNA primase/helicase